MGVRGWLLLAVLGLALALRLWVLVSLRFDGLYGQDAFAYYYHGVALWRDHALTYPWPWLHQRLPLFFPLGESALLAGVFAILGRATPTAALAVSVACGAGTVALVYGLALRVADCLFDPDLAAWTAALAAAPVALAGLQVQAGATIMSDAPALLWGTAALWLWTMPDAGPGTSPSSMEPGTRDWGDGPTQYDQSAFPHASPARARPRSSSLPSGRGKGLRTLTSFAAGVCYALAVSTRWEYALLAPAMGAYWWACARPPRRVWPGLTGALLAGIPQSLYSLHYSDPVLHHQWLTGWSPSHLWQASFATVDGVQHYPMSVGAFYLLRPLLSPQSLPLVLAPLLPLGILALAGRPDVRLRPTSRGASPWLLLLLCWWLVPALYLAGVPFESDRFTLIYLPPLAILDAIGFIAALSILTTWAARQRTYAAALAVLWVATGLGVLAADARGGVAALANSKDGDLAAVDWLRGHAPPGAPIATFGLTLMLYHYGDPAAHHWALLDLSAATGADLARAAKNPELIVVVNEGNLAAQWRGLPPDRAYLWLRAHTHLRPVARAGGYIILRR